MLPGGELLVAVEKAPDLQAEGQLILAGEAQLAEGDGHLGGPAAGIDRRLDGPDRVPGEVLVRAVLGERGVALDAGGVDLEGEGGALVEVAVDIDRDVVAVDLVAARHAAVDARRPGVMAADQDVEVLVVVHDLELGGLGRRLAAARVALHELAAPLHLVPAGVVAAAVDGRGVRVDVLAQVDLLVRGRRLGQPQHQHQDHKNNFLHIRPLCSRLCRHLLDVRKRER